MAFLNRKLRKKYLQFIAISLLVTISLLCYLLVLKSNSDGKRWPSELSKTNHKHVMNEYNLNWIDSDGFVDMFTHEMPLRLPSGDDPNPEVRAKRDFVKEMMRHSWDNYVRYAWGYDELKPLSKSGQNLDNIGSDYRLGTSIVDALDTLYIMNMTDEFNRGRQWVARSLNIDSAKTYMSVFETINRFVGGLLASYALTNDLMFLSKARHLADHMLPAFATPMGLPLALINPVSGKAYNYHWAPDQSSILSDVGGLDLEFVYLSAASGATIYEEKVTKIRQHLNELDNRYNGHYINYISPYDGYWRSSLVSIGAFGDKYYEYLIKSWIQTNGTDVMARRMYDSAVDAIERQLVQKSTNGLIYLAQMNSGQLKHCMEHLACFSGGMFALGAQSMTDHNLKEHFMSLGAAITETCAQSYLLTATHIGPEVFEFTDSEEAVALNRFDCNYRLRPEVIESYFYLWRMTHKQSFRDYAWSAAQAIGQYCRTDYGFSGIHDTNDINSTKDDVQQTYFMAETLKYLYLIFSSDDLIDLNDWVFNTAGHPLPVLRGLKPNPKRSD